jgi:NodT family efflux transporter outer membrane factor (OMF) lipoprotein
VSLPSQLVDQRPDVRAAEAVLHEQSANIGVATAAMLPAISLSGSFGSAADPITNLFSPGSGIWSIGAGLTQPIFHGGTLLHQKRAAVAAYDLAAAQYRSTVIGAFQNVADALRALETDADAVKAQGDAERLAAESLNIAQNRYQTGATTFLTLLDAQRTYQQTRIALVQAEAERFADTAALFVALGGGWTGDPEQPRKAEMKKEDAR